MSVISSRPQSMSSSSMGTSRGCHSWASGVAEMVTVGSMDAAEHIEDLLPEIRIEEERADVTSFLFSTAECAMGEVREIEDKCDAEERVIAAVVPLGVVRVKTPGIAHLRVGRLFKGDIPSSLVSSCEYILITSNDGL